MTYNKEYCKPINNGTSVEYAPTIIPPSPLAPTAEEYAAAGWYRNAITPPSPPAGQCVETVTYVVEDGKVVANYTYCDMPLRTRIFSKFKLEEKLFAEGLLDEIDTFIDSQTITNDFGQTMPLRRKYQTANEFREDNPYFSQFYNAIKEMLGVTDEKAEEILSAAEV